MSAPAPTSKNERAVPSTGPEATSTSMRAHVGDEIVVRGAGAGVVARDGEVVGLRRADGSPPYDVRRAEDGRVTLYFPGPDACIRHLTPAPHPARTSAWTCATNWSSGTPCRCSPTPPPTRWACWWGPGGTEGSPACCWARSARECCTTPAAP